MQNLAILFRSSIILILLFSHLQAQVLQDRCQTMHQDAFYHQHNSQLETRAEFEIWLARKLKAYQQHPPVSRATITLPVIVHIIHNGEAVGEGLNISQAQVESQLQVLNQDFRRQVGTAGFNNHPDGADIEIEFCLATVDTFGQPLAETGIRRIPIADIPTASTPISMRDMDLFVKPATIWNPYNYLNIWVCDLTGSDLGYARFPASSTLPMPTGSNLGTNTTDGVVIDYQAFGSKAYPGGEDFDLKTLYSFGRTATHEVGHYLGLLHIFGNQSGCSATDFCADTPPLKAPNRHCPVDDDASCGISEMWDNYMDYTPDVCMSIFTQHQKDRMLTVLQFSPRRKELLNSNVCGQLQGRAPSTDFFVNIQRGCPRMIAHFSTKNTGGIASSWRWHFPGGSPEFSSEPEPVVSYSQRGTFDVSLRLNNAFGTDSMTKKDFIIVNTSDISTAFYREDFENGLNGWIVENPDNGIGWQLYERAAGHLNGKKSMSISCFDYAKTGEIDALISPEIQLGDFSETILSFHHAYRSPATRAEDRLRVFVSTDGGQTYGDPIYDRKENGQGDFTTHSKLAVSFTPMRTQDWCYAGATGTPCASINLGKLKSSSIRLKFEVTNGNGNNIFLDNITISGICKESKDDELSFDLYPSPSTEQFSVRTLIEKAGLVSIEVFDLRGRRTFSLNQETPAGLFEKSIQLENLNPGIYIVRLRTPDGEGSGKLVVK